MKRVFLIFIAFIVLLMPTAAHAQTRDSGAITLFKEASSFDTPGQSLSGIEFQINRLSESPDLSTITVEQAIKGEVLLDAPLFARTTAEGERGVARFTNLPLGSYLVRENPSRVGDISRSVTAPFFVTIPYNGSEGAVYDLVGQPKIQPINIIKSANTSTLRPGQSFNYVLDAVVPIPDAEGKLYRLVIKDPLPAGLSYNGEHRVEKRSLTLNSTLREGNDYSISVSADQEVVLRLTEAALAQLAADHAQHLDLTIRFTIGVTASNDLADGAELTNIGYYYPDGFPENAGNNIPSNSVALRVRLTTPVITTPRDPSDPTSTRASSALSQTPTRPDSTTALGAAGGPGSGTDASGRSLATTGASVIALTILGVIFAALGIFILWRRPSNET
ncbi:isopeptide-forming domain-containing fimbrial protein [Corynebacterium callunae]|uniref:isopeptide-forming domain-containing fimbrial protein n=1 Tax=Corynebacterium callunae TaxID=1721 RepID=UPI0039822540